MKNWSLFESCCKKLKGAGLAILKQLLRLNIIFSKLRNFVKIFMDRSRDWIQVVCMTRPQNFVSLKFLSHRALVKFEIMQYIYYNDKHQP
jgi:hypothetical protein